MKWKLMLRVALVALAWIALMIGVPVLLALLMVNGWWPGLR